MGFNGFLRVFAVFAACLTGAPAMASTLLVDPVNETLVKSIPFGVQTRIRVLDATVPDAPKACVVGTLTPAAQADADVARLGALGTAVMLFRLGDDADSAVLRQAISEPVILSVDDSQSCESPVTIASDSTFEFTPDSGIGPLQSAAVGITPFGRTAGPTSASVPASTTSGQTARSSISSPSTRPVGTVPTSLSDALTGATPVVFASDISKTAVEIFVDLTNPVFEDASESVLLLDFARVTTQSGSTIFAYGSGEFGAPDSGAICGLGRDKYCTSDLYFAFYNPIADLKFETLFFGGADSVLAVIYAGATRLAEFDILKDGFVDFSGYSGITGLSLFDRSPSTRGSRGAAFGNFSYSLAVIPLPGAIINLSMGAIMLAGISRYRRRRFRGN